MKTLKISLLALVLGLTACHKLPTADEVMVLTAQDDNRWQVETRGEDYFCAYAIWPNWTWKKTKLLAKTEEDAWTEVEQLRQFILTEHTHANKN